MNDKQFTKALKARPWTALESPHACARMSAVQKAWCEKTTGENQ